MTNVYDFDALERQQQPTALAQLGGSFEQNPDDVAKAFNYSLQTGVPPQVILPNMEDFERNYKTKLSNEIIDENDPFIRFINKHPLHAALIHDDLAALSTALDSAKAASIEHPIVAGLRAFGEAFPPGHPGKIGFGGTVTDLRYQGSLNTPQEWYDNYPTLTANVENTVRDLGIPINLFSSAFGGVIGFVHAYFDTALRRAGVSEQASGKFMNDAAGALEQQLMGLGVEAPHVPEVPGAKFDVGKIRDEIEKLRPYFEAGQKPPPGVSEVWDKVESEQAKATQKALTQAVADADATKLKARNPDKLRELLAEIPDAQLRVSGDAVRKLYGDKAPAPDDGLLGWVPNIQGQLGQSDISFSSHDLISHVDKETFEALKDDIAREGEQTVNEGKELAEHRAAIEPSAAPTRENVSLEKTREIPLDQGGTQHLFNIKEDDKVVGNLHISEKDNKLTVDWLGAGGSPYEAGAEDYGSFGAGVVRGILDKIKEEFPAATSISGFRTGGARRAAEKMDVAQLRLAPADAALASTRQAAGFIEPSAAPIGYHGTERDISDIDLGQGGSRAGTPADEGAAYFFATEKAARNYGRNIIRKDIDFTNAREYDATKLVEDPAFVNEMWQAFQQIVTRNDYLKEQAKTEYGKEIIAKRWQEILDRIAPNSPWRNDAGQVRYHGAITGAILNRARAEGADVAIIKNMAEGHGPAQDQYVVLHGRAMAKRGLKVEDAPSNLSESADAWREPNAAINEALTDLPHLDKILDHLEAGQGAKALQRLNLVAQNLRSAARERGIKVRKDLSARDQALAGAVQITEELKAAVEAGDRGRVEDLVDQLKTSVNGLGSVESAPAMPGEAEFDRQEEVEAKYGSTTFKDLIEKLPEEPYEGLPEALHDFLLKQITRTSGGTKVVLVPRAEYPNEKMRHAPGYFTIDQRTGSRLIYLDKDYADRFPGLAHYTLLHEGAHDLTMRALYEDPVFAKDTADLLEEVKDWAKDKSVDLNAVLDYGLRNTREFLAEAFSNRRFQQILSRIQVSDKLAGQLGLSRRTSSLWEAFIYRVKRLIEKVTGKIPNGYSALNSVLRLGERADVMRSAEKEEFERTGQPQTWLLDPHATRLTLGSERAAPAPEPPFYEGKAIGRTEKELSRYEELIAKRDAEDIAWRLRRALRQAELENSKEWKAESDKIRPEIYSDVVSKPEIAAYRFFKDGVFMGEKVSKRPKFEEASLSEEQKAALPPGFVSKKGMHPDDVANLFGFDSGEGLVRALASLEREAKGFKGDIADRITDAEVYRRLTSSLGESAAERLEEAKDHALGLTQMDLLHEKVVALGMRTGAGTPLTKAEMDFGARKLLAEKTFGGLKSDKILAEAGKAGRLVERSLLENKPLEAFKAAQDHYTLSVMAKEARKVEKEAKWFDKTAKRYGKREPAGLPVEYANWVHDILGRVGKPVMRSEEDLRREINAQPHKTLESFLDYKEGMGIDIDIPESLVDPTFRQDIKTMTVAEARDVIRGVKELIQEGRDENKIIVAGEKFDKKQMIHGQMVPQLEKLDKTTAPIAKGPRLISRWVTIAHLIPERLLARWDGDRAFGVFNKHVGRPMYEAANYSAVLSRQIAGIIRKDLIDKANLKESIPNTIFKIPLDAYITGEKLAAWDWDNAAPIPMTRKHLRAVLLNMGNPDNLSRLAKGYNLEEGKIIDWANRYAKKEDWDWAQKHGNMFQVLKDIGDNKARQRGKAPPEAVELSGVDTPYGKYPGWYHPIIKDETVPTGVEEKVDGKLFKDAYTRAGTPKGYTKKRTNHVHPVSLELDAIPGRLMQEIHDIAFRDAVVNAGKVFYDKDFITNVNKHYGKEYGEMLQNWLQDVANSTNGKDKQSMTAMVAFNYFWKNALGTLVGLNVHTIEKHTPTAAIMSIAEVGGLRFAKAFGQMWGRSKYSTESNWRFAMSKSEELQRRHQNIMESVSGAYTQLPAYGSGWATFNRVRESALSAGTYPVAQLDLLSAVPTWLAEYGRMIGEGRSEGDAIYSADTAVRRAHGSTAVTNRPWLMRKQPILTPLYGFFSGIWNKQWESAWRAKEGLRGRETGNFPSLTMGIFASVIATAALEEMVSPVVGKNDSWGEAAAKTILTGVSSSWIGLRDIAKAIVDRRDPSLGMMNVLPKEVTDMFRDLTGPHHGFDRQHTAKMIKHAIVVFGAATGLTNSEEGNVAEYLWNLKNGKERPPADAKELWRGLTKGETRPMSDPDYIERMLPGRVVRKRGK